MDRMEVPARAQVRLGRVNGDLHVGDGATLDGEGGGPIVVAGRVEFDGSAVIRAPFE